MGEGQWQRQAALITYGGQISLMGVYSGNDECLTPSPCQ